MLFKRKKFYSVIVALILFMSVACGAIVLAVPESQISNGSTATIPAETPTNPKIPVEEQQSEPANEEEKEEQDRVKREVQDKSKNWSSLLKYAVNKTFSSTYESYTESNVQTSYSMISVNQKIKTYWRVASNACKEEVYSLCDAGALSGMGSNMYRNFYNDGTKTYKRDTNLPNYDFDAETYNFLESDIIHESTKEDLIAEELPYPCQRQSDFNTTTCSQNAYDKVSNKSNYILILDYDLTKIKQSYYNNFSSTGQIVPGSVNFSDMQFEIHISKTTGLITYIKTTSAYTMVAEMLGAKLTCKTVSHEYISNVGKDYTVERGY